MVVDFTGLFKSVNIYLTFIPNLYNILVNLKFEIRVSLQNIMVSLFSRGAELKVKKEANIATGNE